MVEKKYLGVVIALRQNARMPLTALSKRTGLPVSTLFERVHNPASLGIRRMSALLDFGLLGYHCVATMLLKAGAGRREELQEHLRKSEEVNSLFRVNNGFDFMAECVFRDLQGLEGFCENLENKYGVKNKEVHFVVEELKREGFLEGGVFYG